jgi:hypothetical protein
MNEKEIVSRLNDNEEAHEIINDLLVKIGKRLQALEEAVQELPTPDKTYYKPKGTEDYLTLCENLDAIYERLERLENGRV